MKIVTAVNADYMPILNQTLPINLRYGDVTVCRADVPEPGAGLLPNKPDMILRSYERSQPMVWLDADAWIIRPIQRCWDFDVGVTMRRDVERGQTTDPDRFGYLNCGVMFINNTAGALQLVEAWRNEVPKTKDRSDQRALNDLLRRENNLERGTKFWAKGATVRVFTTDEFNWFYFGEEVGPNTKILHMKSDMRRRHNLSDWTSKIFAG